MDRLWTPWRMQYIANDKGDGCIFCAALAQQDDRESLLLHRGRHAFVMLNKYPYNNGHLLVVPYSHTGDLSALDSDAHAELMGLIAQGIEWLKAASRPEGFNAGLNLGKAGGAGVTDHLHFHVIPRWSGDTNFMTLTGETRVLPESLDDTWSRLRAVIDP